MTDGKKTVLVMGTGTIGGAFIRLLLEHADQLNLNVLIYKHSPREKDVPEIKNLITAGAELVVHPEKSARFNEIGLAVSQHLPTAICGADVVVDCSAKPEENIQLYSTYRPKQLIAQGNAPGDFFGPIFVTNVNEISFANSMPTRIKIGSCNVHVLSTILSTLYANQDGFDPVDVEIYLARRFDDFGSGKTSDGPQVIGFNKGHYAKDMRDIFEPLGADPNQVRIITQGAMIPSPMHLTSLRLTLPRAVDKDEILSRLEGSPFTLTRRDVASDIFVSGYTHLNGHSLTSPGVIPVQTIGTDGEVLFLQVFTVQYRSAILSTLVATLAMLCGNMKEATEISAPIVKLYRPLWI